MRFVSGLVFSLLVASTLWGQTATAPSAAPVSQPNSAAPQPGLSTQPMSPAEMNSWRMGRNMRMMAELKAMRTKLDEMSANAAKVKDPTLKQQLELDNQLWAMMLSHLEMMSASAPQSRIPNRYAAAEQMYRQPRTIVPPPTAAPAAPEVKPATPPDHP